MPDHRTPPPGRKPSLIAPVVIAAVVGALVLVVALAQPRKPEIRPVVLAPPEIILPPVKAIELDVPTLSRNELIQGANAAARAYANASTPATGKAPLVGKAFSVQIPFGCDGAQNGGSVAEAYVEYDAEKGSVRLLARPIVLTGLPLVQGLREAPRLEAAEGFWLPRPWTNSEDCPPRRDAPIPATPTPPAGQTLGLAQLFEKGGSRLSRRSDRPYEFVRKISKDDASLLAHSYRLRLDGHLAGYQDGRAVHCWSESADHRPICLYAVTYDRVAFEDAETHEVLAEWRD